MEQLQEEFASLMAESARLWRMQLNDRLKPFGLSYAKFAALLLLIQYKEGIKQNEMAAMLSIENPTLARMLGELEKEEWIERKSHPSDGRVKIVLLTKNAEEKFSEIKKVLADLRFDILSGIDANMLQSNIEVSKIMSKNLSKLQEGK